MKIQIQGKSYALISDYKEDKVLMESFNKLTNKVWEFDFESWYKSGYWDDSCHLYSLMDGEEMVSHITVTELDCVILGKKQTIIQLGTVMTDENYRGLGLNRVLMEFVLHEWDDKCDMIYLFANDTVLDFYPKFGFVPVKEHEALWNKKVDTSILDVRKMNIDNKEDLLLLDKLSREAVPLFNLSIINNVGLIMFYCKAIEAFKDNLYYLKELDAIVVAEYEDHSLIVHDILSATAVDFDSIFTSLMKEEIENVVLRFMPNDEKGYKIKEYKDDDLTLFVSSNMKELFANNKLIFPILSHT